MLQRIVVIVLSLVFLGLATFDGAQHARALRRLLRRHSARLQATIDRAHHRAERTGQMLRQHRRRRRPASSPAGEIVAVNDTFVECCSRSTSTT